MNSEDKLNDDLRDCHDRDEDKLREEHRRDQDRLKEHHRNYDEPVPWDKTFEQERENVEIERSKWRSRRQMAWVSLIAMMVVTGLCVFFVPIEKMKVIEEMISWFFITMASVIGAYMGFTTWSSISKK
jgi:hypothetical protein